MAQGPVVVRSDGRLAVIPPEDTYDVLTISLATARNAPGVALGVSGTSWSVVSLTGSAKIKMNSTGNAEISLRGSESYVGDFSEIYLINDAQPMGQLVLFVGRKS